jgi:adenosine deaminase
MGAMLRKKVQERLAYIKLLAADPALREDVRRLPKCELHVHLGGSIRRETAVRLAEKNGVPLPAPKKDFLAARTPLEFFGGGEMWELFHNTYKWHWSCVRSCEDLSLIVREFLEDSYLQGIALSEFTVSGSYVTVNFPFDEWTGAVADGILEAQKKYPIKAGAVLDISRRLGPESALNNVRQLIERRPSCICGIGMGG